MKKIKYLINEKSYTNRMCVYEWLVTNVYYSGYTKYTPPNYNDYKCDDNKNNNTCTIFFFFCYSVTVPDDFLLPFTVEIIAR